MKIGITNHQAFYKPWGIHPLMTTKRPNIVITGVDRSGTTLMHLLVRYGFFDVSITDGESAALDTNIDVKTPNLCSKKTYDLMNMDKIIKELEAKIVWMVRDPRDCVVSKASMNGFKKYWQKPRDLQKKLGPVEQGMKDGMLTELDGHVCIVKFEHLLIDPDGVQEELSYFLSLDIALPFSKCHRRFAEAERMDGGKYIHKLNGVRPPDPTTIGNWSRSEHDEWWEDIVDDDIDKGAILKLVRLFGYEQDDDWLEKHMDVIAARIEEE